MANCCCPSLWPSCSVLFNKIFAFWFVGTFTPKFWFVGVVAPKFWFVGVLALRFWLIVGCCIPGTCILLLLGLARAVTVMFGKLPVPPPNSLGLNEFKLVTGPDVL